MPAGSWSTPTSTRPVAPGGGNDRSSLRVALDRPVEDVIAPEDSDALWTALRGLAPGQRRVVVLRHYWGLSVDETAADLGISPGTVKSQTSDALARLRDALSVAATPGEHP